MIDRLLSNAVTRCLKHQWQFVLYRLPGAVEVKFLCDPDKSLASRSNKTFFATAFNHGYASRLEIRDVLSADDVMDYNGAAGLGFGEPEQYSTPIDEYLDSVNKVITLLKETQDKCVISRVECCDINSDIITVCERIFSDNPKAFCALFGITGNGCWIVASPEILLRLNGNNNRFETMSLAGTRPKSDDATPWNTKNINEQQIVTQYIVNALEQLHITYDTPETCTLRSNNVEHICTTISGTLTGDNDVADLLDTLSPTPAIAGYPKARSIDIISTVERHTRRLYGGYFGIEDDEMFLGHVMLRCAQLSTHHAAIYAGGGITAASVATDEFNETKIKALPLKQALTQ